MEDHHRRPGRVASPAARASRAGPRAGPARRAASASAAASPLTVEAARPPAARDVGACGRGAGVRMASMSRDETQQPTRPDRPIRSRARPSTRWGAGSTRPGTARGRRLRLVEVAARVRHPRLHLRPRRHPGPGPRLHRGVQAADATSFEVLFASKAAPVTAIYEICQRGRASRSMSPPAASCTWPCAAGFEPERIYMHGNNKTEAELRYAFESGVGCLVLDSFDEIARADALAGSPAAGPDPAHPGDQALDPLLHPDRASSTRSSASASPTASPARAVDAVDSSRHLELVGLHAHIGSQIFELEPYREGDRGAGRLRPRSRARDHQHRWRPRHRLRRRRRAAVDRPLRRGQGRGGSRRLFDRRAEDPDRAGPLAGRQRRPDRSTGSAPSRRSRASAPTSRSTAACPTICGRCSTTPATRR